MGVMTGRLRRSGPELRSLALRLTIPTSRNREMSMFEPFRRQFEDMMSDFGRWPAMDWPSKEGLATLDDAETTEAIEIAPEAPGMAENDLNVVVEGQALVISGEKKSESENQNKDWRVVERSTAPSAASRR